MTVKQQKIVITGGATSVGLATAIKFLDLSHAVHICDINEKLLNEALAAYPGLRGSLTDVGDIASVELLFQEVFAWMDGVDILVNNVGIAGPHAALEDVEYKQWNETINVNLSGMFYTTKQVLEGMKARRHGVIINISSGSTRTGLPSRIPYVVSKAGVEAMTRTLAREVGPYNVRCNAILPGMINNERMRSIVRHKAETGNMDEAEVVQSYLKFISMRTMIEPEEIADAIVFLSSPQARHITGQIIGVDGNLEWEV
jgi:NAD(P)-dependent dehydrogenase (short-subunit alcohol dehydrogenase family)